MPKFNREDLEDLIAEAIGDSMGVDWTYRDGARAVIRALEGILHSKFDHLRQHGEWFTDDGEIRRFIEGKVKFSNAEYAK